MKSLMCVVPVVVVLAGCGGGGGGNGASLSEPVTFATLGTEFASYETVFDGAELTPVENLPAFSRVTYSGVAAYTDNPDADEDDLIDNPTSRSLADLSVDFASKELTGRLYSFRSADTSQSIRGELRIANGEITENVFLAEVGGRLTEGGIDVVYDGGLLGGFIGPNAERLIALGEATGSSPGYEDVEIFGAIFAER